LKHITPCIPVLQKKKKTTLCNSTGDYLQALKSQGYHVKSQETTVGVSVLFSLKEAMQQSSSQ